MDAAGPRIEFAKYTVTAGDGDSISSVVCHFSGLCLQNTPLQQVMTTSLPFDISLVPLLLLTETPKKAGDKPTLSSAYMQAVCVIGNLERCEEFSDLMEDALGPEPY